MMNTIFADERQKQFCLSLVASCVLQIACLWSLSGVHSATHSASRYVVVPLVAARPVFYQRSRIPSQQANVKWSNVGADGPRTLRGPNLRRKFQSAGYRFEEAAPVIGNPELGFAAPFTLSLDQPSRPVEICLGDFGVATSAIGFRRAGHGRRNGFSVSDFDGGGGQKQIDREPDREPVRIISKPTPAYTEDARNKKIEGDMVIDLIFTADRRIVVLQILRSVGYGLDGTGVQAVSRIVFRPAKDKGRAVDFRARVRVEFRLAPFQDSENGRTL